MAHDTPPRQMSLIPYATEPREIVLRRGSAVVVLDPDSHQLSVGDASDQSVELTGCPYCHRPWLEDDPAPQEEERGRAAPRRNPPFVSPDYFGMLAASQRATPTGSVPGTPDRRLFQPALQSGRSRDVSGATGPPTGAAFVASEPAAASGEGISSSAFSPGFFKQFFVEKRELGRGGNGVVLLIEHLMDRVSLGEFACKRIPVGNDHAWLEKVLVEVQLLKKVPHKNLVAYHWVWLEDHQPSTFAPRIPCLWILQEYCNGGDLHSHVLGPKEDEPNTAEKLKQRRRRRSNNKESPVPSDLRGPSKLSFDDIFSFFRDITSGLHHLHSKGYIHRDLKPSNCLLQRDGPRIRVLISDFGEVQAAGGARTSTGATGTISYCAPEVLQHGVGGRLGDFTTKSDIFSLGMIVYFMCFGRLPYSNADDINEEKEDLNELRAEIMEWTGFDDETRVRPDLPEKLYRFLRRLLSVDPDDRPSTGEILASIKAGVAMGEDREHEGNAPRVSDLDRSSPQARRSSYITRPSLATALSRPASNEDAISVSPMRSPTRPSARADSGQRARPESPIAGSVVVRQWPKLTDLPPPSSQGKTPPPQSPRLMLPSPPARPLLDRMRQQIPTSAIARVVLFIAKLLTLALPCSPYATNAWLMYPLMGLAGLELGLLLPNSRRTVMLLGVHVSAVVLASRSSTLCEVPIRIWEGR